MNDTRAPLTATAPSGPATDFSNDAAFRLLAENLPTLCWMARADGFITWYNRRWYDYTGTTPEQMEGWGWQSVHHSDHLSAVLEAWTQSIATGEPFKMVFPLRGEDGVFRPFLTLVQPYRSASGEVIYWFGSNTDISGQVDAEREVSALRAEQATVLNQLEEGVVIADETGRITYVNEAATRLHGVRRLDIGPEDYSQAYHLYTEAGEPYPPHELPLARAVAGGEVVTEARWRIKRPDGSQVIAIGNAQPLTDARGRRSGAILTLRDDTARFSAEQALRELNDSLEQRVRDGLRERKLLADVVETTDALILVLDREYNILAANKAHMDEFERIYGVRERVGDNILLLLADQPEQQAQVRDGWDSALKGEASTLVDAFGDPNRDRPYYEIKFNVLRDAEGEQIGAYQFVYDVTDRVRRQAELDQARDALRQAQKMEAVGQLTGGIAHDFNNLLTVIRSSADLLRKRDLPADRQRRYVDAISDTADRAAKLTGQLLSFSRRQALQAEVFDAAERVERIGEMLRTLLGSRIELVIDAVQGSCFVSADPGQFETLLVNLAVNARDAMDGEGRLTIHVSPAPRPAAAKGALSDPGFVAMLVSDTGVGIPPELAERVFEPFFTTKEVGKGTGLGLSQVYGFVKQSGGEIEVQSSLGVGTTFTILLPAVAAPIDVPGSDRPEHRATSPRGRILVVDDNPQVGEFAAQLLSDLGYETQCVGSAAEALSRLERDDASFDLIFSDVIMPGMNGVQLGRTVKARWPGTAVVLTSGYSHIPGQDGEHDFPLLKKPYSVEELFTVVSAAGQEVRR